MSKTPRTRLVTIPAPQKSAEEIRFAKLTRVNSRLKKQLNDINQKLSDLINELTSKEAKRDKLRVQGVRPETELVTAKTRLAVYEKQHAKIKTQYDSLMNPDYRLNLTQRIKDAMTEVENSKESIRVKEIEQKERSRVLSTTQETGESLSMLENYMALQNELIFWNTKCEKLDQLCQSKANSMQIMTDRMAKSKEASVSLRQQMTERSYGAGTGEASDLETQKDALIEDHIRKVKTIGNEIAKAKARLLPLAREQKTLQQKEAQVRESVQRRERDVQLRTEKMISARQEMDKVLAASQTPRYANSNTQTSQKQKSSAGGLTPFSDSPIPTPGPLGQVDDV